MKRIILLAAPAALVLLGASIPPNAERAAEAAAREAARDVARDAARDAARRAARDAVRREGEISSVVAADRAEPAAPAAAPAPATAPHAVQPVHAARSGQAARFYPRCSATVTDRCVQGTGYARSHGSGHSGRRMQLAMRAGERG